MIPPDRRHNRVLRTASIALVAALACLSWAGSASALMISEVNFNPVGGFGGIDDGQEWIELYNEDTAAVFLDDYALGWGTASYTEGTLDLDGLGWLAPGAFIVIYDTDPGYDFAPDLPDGFITAAGLGLFAGDAANIDASVTPPVDAVVYSTIWGGNWNGLVDETGAVSGVDVTTGGATETIQRSAGGTWTPSGTGSPGTGTPVPEPGTGLLTAFGLGLLALRRSR